MPIIVLEGPDYSGKSTLAEEIKRNWLCRPHTTATIVHTGSPGKKPDDMDIRSWASEQTKALVTKIQSNVNSCLDDGHLVIFDRLAWGAPIYGPLHRKETNYREENFGDLGQSGFMHVDSVLARAGAITVHVGTSLHALLERAGQREDPYLDDNSEGKTREQQLQELWFRYHQFNANVGQYLPSSLEHPIFMGDFENPSVREDIELLIEMDSIEENKRNWIDQGRLRQYLQNIAHSAIAKSTESAVVADYLLDKAIYRQIKAKHNFESKDFLSSKRKNSDDMKV